MTSVADFALGTLDIGGTHVTAALADITKPAPAGVELPGAPITAGTAAAAGTAALATAYADSEPTPDSVREQSSRAGSDGPAAADDSRENADARAASHEGVEGAGQVVGSHGSADGGVAAGGVQDVGGVVGIRAESVRRHELRSDGPADEILATLVAAARELELPGTAWLGIAIPGPFDIVRGIGLYRAVGKFDSLNGVDVRTPVAQGLGLAPDRLVFVPDAQAFLRGEWVAGAAAGHERAAGITLGTGVGSAWLADGELVAAGKLVPPEGRADLLEYQGRPLEDTISRRAILAAYAAAGGSTDGIDVQDVFERARQGEETAKGVIDTAVTALGRALAPWLDGFGATVLVVGGAMSGSWDLIEPPLRTGLVDAAPALDERLTLSVAREREQSLLVGAAWQCARTAAATG